jgi:glycosyltransferase involved in cell wall biosynthesis
MARILIHIHALRTGGAERVALQFAAWLLEAGHTVVVLTPCGVPADVFPLPPGLDRRWGPPDHGLARLPGIAAYPFKLLALAALLRRERFDLAIGLTTRPALNLLLASLGSARPVVVAERNYPPAKPLPLPWRLLRRWLYPQAALQLVQTARIGAWLEQQHLAQRVAVVPNPVTWPLPVQPPRVDPAALLPQGAQLLLAVGTKPLQKGFDRLLAAFARLAPDAPAWWLALPGVTADHPELQALLAASATAPWRERLLLPGPVGNLADWYGRAQIFALTSRYEGFPNVLVEAMAAGCACLAIDCPTGPRELLQHDHNGVLLAEDTGTDGLTTALVALMADPDRRHRLGVAATGVRQQLAAPLVKELFLQALAPCLEPKVLVLAPTRRSPTETFVRANLARLPLRQVAFFGDEFGGARPWQRPGQLAYGLAITLSKACTRLGLHRLATVPASLVTWLLIRWHQPDVVLAEFGFHAARVMDGAAWAKVPLVVHFRGADASADRRLGQLQERYRRLMRLAGALVVKSAPMRQVLVGLGASPAAITISPSGANAELFHGGCPAQAPPTVLFVGRFVAKKAPLDALAAFARARAAAPPELAAAMRLVLVGEGPLRPALEQQIQALGLGRQVELAGLQPPEQVAARLRQCRCLLLPSRTAPDGDAEGCPVVVLEAQLAGVPVVSTVHAGIPEVVLDGETGLLAPEGDVPRLAEALLQLLAEPELAARLGQAGQRRASSRFTVAHHVDTLAAVLREQARPR